MKKMTFAVLGLLAVFAKCRGLIAGRIGTVGCETGEQSEGQHGSEGWFHISEELEFR